VSLAQRLALLAAGLAVALVATTTEFTLSWTESSRLADSRRQAEALAETWAVYLTRTVKTPDSATVAPLMGGWPSQHLTATSAALFAPGPRGLARVAGSDGLIVTPTLNEAAALTGRSMVVWRTPEPTPAWRIATPVGAPRPHSVLSISVSIRLLEVQARTERRRAYLVATIAAIGIWLGIWWLVRRWVGRPLSDLETAMDETQALGLKVNGRAVTTSGPEEFRRLGQRYVDLEMALAARQQELSLEERTRGLERLALAEQAGAEFAHEIGTPLNTVGGHLQLLREDLLRIPEGKHALERVETVLGQVDRLNGIVRAKLRQGSWPDLAAEPVPLVEFAHRLEQIMEPTLRAGGVTTRVRLDSRDPVVAVADPQLLEQVLVNLLKNACEAMPAGGGIELAIGARDGRAIIEVADTGPGLAPTAREALFQPFTSTKGRAGTGLGLVVSRRLARVMGGDLELVPSKVGTTWRVTLPRAASRSNGASG